MAKLLSNKLQAKLKTIQSEANKLVAINQNKLKENEEKTAALKSEIQTKTIQVFNSLFEQQVELIEKTDQSLIDLKTKSTQLMNEATSISERLQYIEAKLSSKGLSNSDEIKEIEAEAEQLEFQISNLNKQLANIDLNYYFEPNETTLKLDAFLVSFLFFKF